MSCLAEERETAIRDNLGLVHSCAQRYKGKGIDYDDLYQAGCVGLLKAVDAFDESRGLRFSTYAVPVILGEIRRLFRDGGTVKVSRSLKELSMKAKRQQELFARQEGREPSVGELAQLLGVEEGQLVEALCAAAPPLSLTHSEDTAEYDLPVDCPQEALAESLALRQALERLPPLEQQLIQRRYFEGQTQTVVAKALGMTQVQVSRREKKILLALREKLL